MTISDDAPVDASGTDGRADFDRAIRTEHNNHSGEALSVLLVDDSKTIRRSASNFLSSAGFTVTTAVDGFDALSKVVEHRPSIVLIDIMMPRLDGYQTCALIKNNADYRDIPVVMLSSKDGLFDKARARVVGSDAHLSKPFTADTLTAAVRKYSQRRVDPVSELVNDDVAELDTVD